MPEQYGKDTLVMKCLECNREVMISGLSGLYKNEVVDKVRTFVCRECISMCVHCPSIIHRHGGQPAERYNICAECGQRIHRDTDSGPWGLDQ